MSLPDHLARFIEEQNWVFARTYADTWPHEYICRDNVDQPLFEELVKHIWANGNKGRFYKSKRIYFEHNGKIYWTMTTCLYITKILNRCNIDQSYEARLEAGTLSPPAEPKPRKPKTKQQ
jgi:hypothetical protein